MKRNYLSSYLISKIRDLTNKPGLFQLKQLCRHCQALTNRAQFTQMQALAASLPLQVILAQQPQFIYKYLTSYCAASFARPVRLAAIVHHYRFLAAVVQPTFFSAVTKRPILWQEQLAGEHFSIELTYPIQAWFEGELSLNFWVGPTLVQMLTLIVVPGALVGVAAPHVLLISQVQGTKNDEAIRRATRLLHDITPASLLVNAAYGLAAALGIGAAAGIGTQEQLGRGPDCYFDYDGFWQQFRGRRLAGQFYLLDFNAPEKPLQEIKAKHRLRTLRKREYKHRLRQLVSLTFRSAFISAPTRAIGMGRAGRQWLAYALAEPSAA